MVALLSGRMDDSCACLSPRLVRAPGEHERHHAGVRESGFKKERRAPDTHGGRHRVDSRLGGAAWQQHHMNSRRSGSEHVSVPRAWRRGRFPIASRSTVAAFGTLAVAVAVVVAVVRTDLYSEPPDADWPALALLALGLLAGETSRRCWIRSGTDTYVTPVYLFAFALLLVGSPTGALWASMLGTVAHAVVVRSTPVSTLMRLSKVALDGGIGSVGVDVARRDLVDGQRRRGLVALGGRRNDDRNDHPPGRWHRHGDRRSRVLTSRTHDRLGARRRCAGDRRGCTAVARTDLDRRRRVQPSTRALLAITTFSSSSRRDRPSNVPTRPVTTR